MDLAGIKPSTVDVEIIHPGTGDPTGLVITVKSSEDEAVKRAQRKIYNQRLKTREKKLSVEKLEEDGIAILTAAVSGWKWNGDAKWNGTKPEFTPDKLADVLAVEWIRKQVKAVVDEEADFFSN